MTFGARVQRCVDDTLSFKVIPTTIISVFVYLAIYISVLANAPPPEVPEQGSPQLGLNVDQAWRDLHYIAAHPHPYNSHANEDVHSYILDRVHAYPSWYSNVYVDNDRTSNGTWATGRRGTYFEGTNILVKIEGSNFPGPLDGILFSAHYDSVSTAPGATDDGMGAVTLLQMIDYYARNPPKRTLIFNINNGEEEGLNGALAFLHHPWSKLVKTFINLEGAGAGGRPMMFRVSSTNIARAFQNVEHPLANVIASDGFSLGLVKSGTDFTVYEAASLAGLDLAFFSPRSKYHTAKDSIPSLGGKDSLWNMMENTLTTSLALIEEDFPRGGGKPVFFDLFGEALAVISFGSIFAINVTLLVVGPIVVAVLTVLAVLQRRVSWRAVGWGRFPVSVIFASGATFAVALVISSVNPLIIYSSPIPVFLTLLTTTYVVFYSTIAIFKRVRPSNNQKSLFLFESYIFWWMFLVVGTVFVNVLGVGGLYFVTFFHIATLAALLVGFVDHYDPVKYLRYAHLSYDDEDHLQSDERTPLIRNGGSATNGVVADDDCKDEYDEDKTTGIWLLQFLLTVPFPVILVSQLGLLLSDSLGQTLADGSSATIVYFCLAFVSILSILPLVPFIHKIHPAVCFSLFVVLVISGFYNLLAFPFTSDAPLKVKFFQSINLDNGTNQVELSGLGPWIGQDVVRNLPSSWDTPVICGYRSPYSLAQCEWEGLRPDISSKGLSRWVTFGVSRTGQGSGQIVLNGVNTRNCKIKFDYPVLEVDIVGGNNDANKLFPILDEGITELRLFRRDWVKAFNVNVKWDYKAYDAPKKMTGRVACEWAEKGSAIPALKEALQFVPDWIQVTKREDGLVEGWKAFEL